MQDVTTESILGTIIGHLNVEKARLIAENVRLSAQAALVPKLTAENKRLSEELMVARADAEKRVEANTGAHTGNGSEKSASLDA